MAQVLTLASAPPEAEPPLRERLRGRRRLLLAPRRGRSGRRRRGRGRYLRPCPRRSRAGNRVEARPSAAGGLAGTRRPRASHRMPPRRAGKTPAPTQRYRPLFRSPSTTRSRAHDGDPAGAGDRARPRRLRRFGPQYATGDKGRAAPPFASRRARRPRWSRLSDLGTTQNVRSTTSGSLDTLDRQLGAGFRAGRGADGGDRRAETAAGRRALLERRAQAGAAGPPREPAATAEVARNATIQLEPAPTRRRPRRHRAPPDRALDKAPCSPGRRSSTSRRRRGGPLVLVALAVWIDVALA